MTKALSTQHSTLNTVKISDEVRFLIACCQTEPSDDDIKFITSLLNANASSLCDDSYTSLNAQRLTLITSMASSHGVLPLVYKTIKNLSESYSSLITHYSSLSDLLIDLKSMYTQIAHRNMLMSAELIHILKLFKENGIEALAFKGPALSQMAYGDITLRQFGDLDILIKKVDISLMIDLLIIEGYIPQIELGTKMDKTLFDALNVIGFYKSTSNILVEVHWELLSKNYAITWDEKALWTKKRETVCINGTDIPLLASEEHLLYLCVHGSKHLFERLEWICDIERSIEADPAINWKYLLNEAEKRGVKRMLFLGLTLCHSFFGLKLPTFLHENIQQDKVLPKLFSKVILSNFSESTQVGKKYNYFILIWNMREKLSDKLHFTWYAFFAPQFDDFQFIKLPKQLAFLYPIVRQFRLIKKYI